MSPNYQLNLPPTEVEPINPLRTQTVKYVNLPRITRTALRNVGLTQRFLASLFGQSEQLTSAQLSDDAEDKHLSCRKLGRVDELSFWKEFIRLLCEDIGLTVIVLDTEQATALHALQASSANFSRVMNV